MFRFNEDQYLSSLVFHLANYRQYNGSLFTVTDIKGRQKMFCQKQGNYTRAADNMWRRFFRRRAEVMDNLVSWWYKQLQCENLLFVHIHLYLEVFIFFLYIWLFHSSSSVFCLKGIHTMSITSLSLLLMLFLIPYCLT